MCTLRNKSTIEINVLSGIKLFILKALALVREKVGKNYKIEENKRGEANAAAQTEGSYRLVPGK